LIRVIVIGGGIIGSSVAYHLIIGGAQVTVIPGNDPGGSATKKSFGWINAAEQDNREYFEFRLAAMSDWHRLEKELDGLIRLNWNGSLWWESKPKIVEQTVDQLSSWGYPIQLVSRKEARTIEPSIAYCPEYVAHANTEGSVSPDNVAQLLLDRAVSLGAIIRPGVADSLIFKGGRVVGVSISGEQLSGDEIIIATGACANTLLAQANVRLPINKRSGLLAYSYRMPTILNGIILAPGIHIRQLYDGRLIAGRDFSGAGFATSSYSDEAQLIASEACKLLGPGHFDLADFSIGVRPIPDDGLPAIGRISNAPGLYVLVMHSGITLAPIVGRLTADEIIHGRSIDLFEMYSIERFLK
tara:strand:+ start:8005 stop:9072 length:1068 start_codon:yes stop_codon:yes gene_type:complete